MKRNALAFAMLVASFAASLEAQTAGPANGHLVIHGGGGSEICEGAARSAACEEHLDEFVRLAGGEKSSLVIIPTAAIFEDAPPPAIPQSWFGRPLAFDAAFRARYEETFRKRGIRDIAFLHTIDREEADSDSFAAPLERATAVWITGGRQWRLADAYLDTNTERALHRLLDRGGVIGGGSAGAAIQGSYLVRGDTRGNLNIMGDHERGFGFLKNSAIDIHVLPWNRHYDLNAVIEKHPELLGIGIDGEAAIVVRGDWFRVIGQGYVAIHEARLRGRFYFLERGDRFHLGTRTAYGRNRRTKWFPAMLPPHETDPHKLATISGRYRYDHWTVSVEPRAGRLLATLAPDDRRELIPLGDDLFYDENTGARVRVVRGADGNATELVWDWPRCTMYAKRVP